eukprot:NODE_373_length_2025_cov_116.840358_g366_i0.p1 GENE.NODE_373_length_2025_cov_116.840358_g366_i0~~NODE_373_length_2025_cov_116.840358_g366_i0.p1  ORF type:complete len:606 (-),score=190.81 NODE_373_length_2025_cov_116.840358_g366_i0:208-1980(-)
MAAQSLDEVGLEAARKQKVRNLQLKTVALENEEYIQELHVTDFNATQKQKLDAAHEKAWKLLQQVEAGTRWNLMHAYDLPKLLRVCGLTLNPKELFNPTDKPQFMDIVSLRKTLQELKTHRNKNKVVSFTDLFDKYIAALEGLEESLRKSQLDATEYSAIPAECMKALEDCMNVSGATMAMANNDERIKAQLKLIERANEVQNIALADGEMAVAEEQYYTKISLMEMLMELINNKFVILDQTKEENKPFAKVPSINQKSVHVSQQLTEKRERLKAKCEADLTRLEDAMQKADRQDAESFQQYVAFSKESDERMRQNIEQQEQCWNIIQEQERQLQKIGTERFEEVKRRLEEFDREEKRKVEYQQFLDVCSGHKRGLQLTIFNCDVALRAINTVRDFVTESVDAMVKRHHVTNDDLGDARLEVYKEKLEAFRQLYLTLGQLRYKKEKKIEDTDAQIRKEHIQLEFCIETFDPNAKKHSATKKELYTLRAVAEEEMEMISEKMEALSEEFKECEAALDAAGIEFLHPETELAESNLHRRTKVIDMKLSIGESEEAKLEKEREAIKTVVKTKVPRSPQIGAPSSPVRQITGQR